MCTAQRGSLRFPPLLRVSTLSSEIQWQLVFAGVSTKVVCAVIHSIEPQFLTSLHACLGEIRFTLLPTLAAAISREVSEISKKTNRGRNCSPIG